MTALLLSLLLAPAFAAGGISASSHKDGRDAALAVDGLLQTSWAEGEGGYGEGQWLELDLGKTTQLDGVSFWPGDLQKGARSYREGTRPKLVHVLVDGEPVGEPLRLQDEIQRVDVRIGKPGRRIRVQVEQVFEGVVFSDMAIAELAVNYPMANYQERYDKWLGGKEAQRLSDEFKAQVEQAYTSYKAAEFGDSEALGMLMDAAADGPEFTRARVQQLVPPGFRAQAIQSSELAQTALRKLKDANAIPAIELAALRAVGDEQDRLHEIVELFYAYQDLVSGGNHNVPYWGTSGWALGALRGFDEPLAIEMDRLNNVYVADTGNNRVQMYNDQGRPERNIGAPPDLSNSWFGQPRPWYVSGGRPGTDPGEWTQPLDVELIPQKDSDWMAAIDYLGRIQIFDADGHPIISWTLETHKRPEPKLGGQAYLMWIPQKQWLLGIIRNEAVAFTLDSEEVARWKIEDGTPNAAEVSKKGRLLLAFGDQVVRYDADGFRFGTVIDHDILGRGWEDMDMTLDEEGKLWIVTDTGWVYKFKKPGKLDFKVRAIDFPLFRQRIAIREGMLFYTASDAVHQVDVLQVMADQAAEAERAKREEEEL